jgi:uncharacterized LabA/DUF88 family protein
MALNRVVVFFDWQNVYMRAREAFESTNSSSAKGQTDPVDLAYVLLDKIATRFPDEAFELSQIRIYRGRPTQQSDPKAYDAFQRQAARWALNNKVHPRFNDLRYPDDWGDADCTDSPREKGIDVALAVDLITMARDNLFDLGIVMSADYDLVPAIQHVYSRRKTRGDGPRVEVAAWKSDQGDKPLRIQLPHDKVWCTWLDRSDYWGVVDETDYKLKAEHRSGPRPGARPTGGR